jgi:hypothetical protein
MEKALRVSRSGVITSAPPRGQRRSARGTRSIAWLVAGDRSGLFARSFVFACLAAAFWTLASYLAERQNARQAALLAARLERLLFDLDEAGTPSGAVLLAQKFPVPRFVAEPVRRAIADASASVGVDRDYLTAVAAVESSFDPAAHARGTTAAGLYQFTEETWLRVVKVFGAKHGLADDAERIAIKDNGEVTMPQGAARDGLLRKRTDPAIAAVMAAELARDNEAKLAQILGRPVTPAETYIAHFLGVGQAARLIEAARSTPDFPAALLLSPAAQSNPDVFRAGSRAISARALVAKIEAYFRRDVPRFTRA